MENEAFKIKTESKDGKTITTITLIEDTEKINPPLLHKRELLILRAYLMMSELSLMFMWQRYNREAEESEKIPWNIRE